MSSNEGSDESAQMRRLDKAFVAHIYKVWMSIKAQDQNLELSPHFVHGRLQDAFAHGHTGKCIRQFGAVYAYCRYFIDRKW